MSGAGGAVALDTGQLEALGVVEQLIFTRVAAEKGATRNDLLKDLATVTAHRLSPSELRVRVDGALATWTGGEGLTGVDASVKGGTIGPALWQEPRGRYRLTEAGAAMVAELLGRRKLPPTWPEIRDTRLLATVLGLAPDPAVLKALARPDGLRASILQKAYGIGGRRVLGASRLRMALALVALERAFGNKIKTGMDAGRGLSVKASRLLAGQLARRPRDFGTDTRLIAALAAEAAGATQADPASLRQAVLRRYVSERLEAEQPSAGGGRSGVGVVAPAAGRPRIVAGAQSGDVIQEKPGGADRATKTGGTDAAALATSGAASGALAGAVVPGAPGASGALGRSGASDALGGPGASRPDVANRPDMAGFARAVQVIAGRVADGWPGNRKAFISRVWQALAEAHPEWGLSEIEFKSMLAEAHRTGHVVLGSADIKNKETLRDVQASAIAYKNTVWHYIRVEN